MNLYELTAHELIGLVKDQKISFKDIYTSLMTQIKNVDNDVNAYVRVANDCPDQLNNLAIPVPIAVKDNICIKNVKTTCASKILEDFCPPYNATVIDKLNKKGIVVIGQTNMDEFAFGSSTENSCYFPTRNPWNLDCVTGGSSGGSSAAVASNQAIWALGSDTGGSIRQPASFCGVVGVKPTYGRVSRYGLIAFASSLDQIGPITKDVYDATLLLNIIAGHDTNDSTSVNVPVPDYTKALTGDISGLTIGRPDEYFVEGIDPEVKDAVFAAIDVLKKKGAKIINISLPHTDYCVATYYIIATAEASSNLSRFDGVQYGLRNIPEKSRKTSIVDMYEETRHKGLGDEVKRRIMLGTYALSAGYYDAYYLRSQKVRTLIRKDFDIAFEECDAIVTPISPTTAFKIGERSNNPLDMYLSDIFTISSNLSGLPAISVPCGFSKAGLPIGLQIIAKPFDEEMMFRISHTYEQGTDWHKQKLQIKKG